MDKNKEKFELIIKPQKKWFDLNFKELWLYRELAFIFAWRDIKVRYKQTALGIIWAILQPVLMVAIFSFFFGKLAKIPSDGRQSRDFCYVDNVVDANILAMQSKKKFGGEFFNIAHGERTNLLEVKKLLEKYSGKKIELEKRKARLGDVRHTYADISKAKKWFGYKPAVNFEGGLKKTVEWYQSL